ncbi:MAG: hypothetical protein AAFV95_03025 [Bacteroidota bacterium]
MFTKSKEFKIANRERKIELIKIDSYKLMLTYLRGAIDDAGIQKKMEELSNFGLLSRSEIISFLKERIVYEAYQCSMGKEEEERSQIKNRMFRFINS